MALPIINPIIAVKIKLKEVGSGWYPVLDDISKNKFSNFVNSFLPISCSHLLPIIIGVIIV